LLDDLDVRGEARRSRDGEEILRGLPAQRLSRGLMIGFSPSDAPRGVGFGDYVVRNVLGIDPQNRVLAVSTVPHEGDRAVFCTRDQEAARVDLVRVCTELDRKSTRLNSSHVKSSYAVFCLKKEKHT